MQVESSFIVLSMTFFHSTVLIIAWSTDFADSQLQRKTEHASMEKEYEPVVPFSSTHED
jgi:hypothetical protein